MGKLVVWFTNPNQTKLNNDFDFCSENSNPICIIQIEPK